MAHVAALVVVEDVVVVAMVHEDGVDLTSGVGVRDGVVDEDGVGVYSILQILLVSTLEGLGLEAGDVVGVVVAGPIGLGLGGEDDDS